MSNLQRLVRTNETALRKTASYYVMHIAVASCVAYAVTGNWTAALALGLLEPSAQAVAYFLHEKAWARAALERFFSHCANAGRAKCCARKPKLRAQL